MPPFSSFNPLKRDKSRPQVLESSSSAAGNQLGSERLKTISIFSHGHLLEHQVEAGTTQENRVIEINKRRLNSLLITAALGIARGTDESTVTVEEFHHWVENFKAALTTPDHPNWNYSHDSNFATILRTIENLWIQGNQRLVRRPFSTLLCLLPLSS